MFTEKGTAESFQTTRHRRVRKKCDFLQDGWVWETEKATGVIYYEWAPMRWKCPPERLIHYIV